MRFLGFLAAALLSFVVAEDKDDQLFILMDSARLFNCEGVKQKMDIQLNDVTISDGNGQSVKYLKAPGNYSIHFRKIRVLEKLGHLSGELSVTLQVPIFEGPAGIRFDLPYQAIPESDLISQKCDSESGIITRDNRPYCRYCDLCLTTKKLEEKLSSGSHKFLPELGKGEKEFGHICNQVDKDTYEIFRTIQLPGKKKLEEDANSKFHGLAGDLKERLNKQKGKIQVFLNLLTSPKPPNDSAKFYTRQQECRCCGNSEDLACRYFAFLNCNLEKCKSDYAEQCLAPSTEIAACYISEFNYRVTSNYADVQEFLRINGIKEEPITKATPKPNRAKVTRRPKEENGADDANPECIAKINVPNIKRYCELFWKRAFCCSRCENVC